MFSADSTVGSTHCVTLLSSTLKLTHFHGEGGPFSVPLVTGSHSSVAATPEEYKNIRSSWETTWKYCRDRAVGHGTLLFVRSQRVLKLDHGVPCIWIQTFSCSQQRAKRRWTVASLPSVRHIVRRQSRADGGRQSTSTTDPGSRHRTSSRT